MPLHRLIHPAKARCQSYEVYSCVHGNAGNMGNIVVAEVLSGQHLGNIRGNKTFFWGNISSFWLKKTRNNQDHFNEAAKRKSQLF